MSSNSLNGNIVNPNDGCCCPPDYDFINGECIKVERTPATYTGQTVPVLDGDAIVQYNKFGLRLYPDLSTLSLPLSGVSAGGGNIILNDDLGNPVTPVISTIQNSLWGLDTTVITGCSGSFNGRLNAVGIQAALTVSKTEVVNDWNALNPANPWTGIGNLQTQIPQIHHCSYRSFVLFPFLSL